MPFLNTDNMVKNWQKRSKLTSDQTKLTAWFVVLAAGEPCNGFGPWPGKKEDILYRIYIFSFYVKQINMNKKLRVTT